MAIKVNLLPEALTVKKGTAAVAKILRSISVVSLVIAIVLGLGLLGFFIVSSFELRSVQTNVESLKNQIKSQETTEQRMVLLKDRLAKIKLVSAIPSSSKALTSISPVLQTLPADASLGELAIDSQRIDSSFSFRNSVSLSSFFGNLKSFGAFPVITLASFGFNPSSGFLAGIRFEIK